MSVLGDWAFQRETFVLYCWEPQKSLTCSLCTTLFLQTQHFGKPGFVFNLGSLTSHKTLGHVTAGLYPLATLNGPVGCGWLILSTVLDLPHSFVSAAWATCLGLPPWWQRDRVFLLKSGVLGVLAPACQRNARIHTIQHSQLSMAVIHPASRAHLTNQKSH